MIKKLYGNTFFRVSFKFVVCFSAMKIAFDLWHLFFLGRKIGLARTVTIFINHKESNIFRSESYKYSLPNGLSNPKDI